jgi:hypothetical protein
MRDGRPHYDTERDVSRPCHSHSVHGRRGNPDGLSHACTGRDVSRPHRSHPRTASRDSLSGRLVNGNDWFGGRSLCCDTVTAYRDRREDS